MDQIVKGKVYKTLSLFFIFFQILIKLLKIDKKISWEIMIQKKRLPMIFKLKNRKGKYNKKSIFAICVGNEILKLELKDRLQEKKYYKERIKRIIKIS